MSLLLAEKLGYLFFKGLNSKNAEVIANLPEGQD